MSFRSKQMVMGLGMIVAVVSGFTAVRPVAAEPNEQAVGSAGLSVQQAAVERAAAWLVRAHQNDDGGFASFSSGANAAPSDPGGTFDAILALSAGGYPSGVSHPAKTHAPIDYLRANAADVVAYVEADGAQAGKAVLALVASGEDPRTFAQHDFVATLIDHLEPEGTFDVSDAFKQSLAILGLAAAGEPIPAASVDWLKGQQGESGAWGDGFGTDENPDATAMAVMALVAAGETPDAPSVADAINFLSAAQTPDGWEYSPGLGAGVNSTALAIQALSAVGEPWVDPAGRWAVGGRTPLQMLLAFQSGTGAFQSDFGQGPFDDFFATVQALPAAAGRSYPLPAIGPAVQRALDCLDGLQDPLTGGWEQFTGSGVNAGGTARAVEAIAAAGGDPTGERWTTADGTDALEALSDLTPAYLGDNLGGRIGIVMQGVGAAGEPHSASAFAGSDLPLSMGEVLSPTGELDSTAFGIFAHAEAMLGMLAVDEPLPPQTIGLLLSQGRYGDWGDPDSNGLALQVIGGLGGRPNPRTLAALRTMQTDEGGWGFEGTISPSSSSEVVQGLSAVGQNPFGPRWSRVNDGTLTNAADAILDLQADNGCWPNAFGPGDDVYGTVDALLLLSQRPGWGPNEDTLPLTQGGR